MFQWNHTSSIAAHAQYVPCEHAEHIAGVCAAFASAAAQLESYAEPIWKPNTKESEWVLV